MAKTKTEQKGFIVYGDNEEVFDRLSDEEAGQLLKGMVKYFNSGEMPSFSGVLEFVFIPIKQQMDRDSEKYEEKCQKNREKIQKYWNKVKGNTTEYHGIPMYTNATNINTDTDTDTKTDIDTDTTTNTKTKTRGGGSNGDDDSFNIWKQLNADDVDRIYDAYPDSGGFLIDEVAAEVRTNRRRVKNAVNYILGYAKKVEWDDKADHFEEALS